MAKKEIIIQLQAYSEPAGKYDPNAPLMGNEDNWFVDDDLSDDIPGRFQAGKDVVLSDMGCLMVVADGMGGMNAGEVASQIAIDTVSEYFAPGRITPEVAANPKSRREILERLIQDADLRIKSDARTNPEHAGMGSTIILAWIVGDRMTLSWCGDSRAYRWNPKFGIEPLSTDHSYVQQLVAQGVITYADTFDHPQGNLVTRSLGDPNNAAKPDTREFDVYQDDIIMLCSDGLSGVLRDKKTPDPNGGFYPGENLQDIIAANSDSLVKCSSELMRAAEQADWYDNVTVLLCQIKEGGKKVPNDVTVRDNEGPGVSIVSRTLGTTPKKLYMMVGAAVLAIGIICGCIFFFTSRGKSDDGTKIALTDSTQVEQITVIDGTAIVEQVKGTDPKAKGGKTDAKPARDGKAAEKKDTAKTLSDIAKNVGGITVDTKESDTPESELTTAKNQPDIQNPKSDTKIKEDNQAWKASLLIEIAKMPVPVELQGYKDRLVDQINTKDSSKDKCVENLNRLKTRVQYFKRLMTYKGKLNEQGLPVFKTLLGDITNPNSGYNPKQWDKDFAGLNKYVLPEHREELGLK